MSEYSPSVVQVTGIGRRLTVPRAARLPGVQTGPWISRAARLHPTRLAVRGPSGALTQEELDRAAAVLADELARRGLQVGDPVALSLSPDLAFAVALHACLRGGFVAVPLDLRLPDALLQERTADCSVTLTADDVAAALAADAPAKL